MMREWKRLFFIIFFAVLELCGIGLCQESPTVSRSESSTLSSVSKIFVNQFVFKGNTIFTDTILAEITRPFEKRMITAMELQEARRRITQFYIDNGFINSGAIIPDQQVTDGRIVIEIIEGKLTEVEISGNDWVRTHYIFTRLFDKGDFSQSPLNVHDLQYRLKLLKQDRLIKNIHAELSPGIRPGQSYLTVRVEEESPWIAELIVNNHNSPSISAFRTEATIGHENLTGWGDRLTFTYGRTRGLDEYNVDYAFPITRKNTILSLGLDKSESKVVSDPFESLDIRSKTTTWSAGLKHPLRKTLSEEFVMGVELERSNSETFMLNEQFPFVGSYTGENIVSTIRLTQQWVSRSIHHVLAVHSSVNLGMDMFGATTLHDQPDGRFLSWLGQIQWLQRLNLLDSQFLLRAYAQLSNDWLLPVEKFAIGGAATVRGYRENQLTTDNGFVMGIEWRIPIATLKLPGISKEPGDGRFWIAPFFDMGGGANTKGPEPDPNFIYSLGLGGRYTAGKRFQMEIYWGYGLKGLDQTGEYDIQDDGIHFQIKAAF